MSFSLHLPVNAVSFGQISTIFLREAFKRGETPPLFLIGDKADINAQNTQEGFGEWLNQLLSSSYINHSRKNPTFKLWHINGSMDSYSEKQLLLTFYELDSPTKEEVNILKNQAKVLVTSKFTEGVFNSHGINASSIPLAFDAFNFHKTEKKYSPDERITFTLCGKFEKRKHHAKILQAWASKFGNNRNYFLNCALYNHFISPEQNNAMVAQALNGNKYFNINFLGYMEKNNLYNDFLNAGDIVIGMSGGEGWGLPEFHSVALGKHSVMLNANAYKEWATPENSILIEPNGKIPAYDNQFFHQGAPFNQGNIFDFNADDFISGCEEAVKRVNSNRLNIEGEKLKEKFTVEKYYDAIMSHLKGL